METYKHNKNDVEAADQPLKTDDIIINYIKEYKNIAGYDMLNLFTQQSLEKLKEYDFRNVLTQFSQLMAKQCDAEVGLYGSIFCLQICVQKLSQRQKQAIPTIQKSNNPMNPFIQFFSIVIQCLNQLVQIAVQFIEIPVQFLSLTQIAAILGQNLFIQQLNIQIDTKNIENLKNNSLTLIKLFKNQKCFDQVIDLVFIVFKIISPLQYGSGNQSGIIGFLKGVKKLGYGTKQLMSDILIQIVSDSYISSIYSKQILDIQSKFNSILQLEQEFMQETVRQKPFYEKNEIIETKSNIIQVSNAINQHGVIIRIINLLYYSELIAEVKIPQSHHIQKLFQSFTHENFEKYLADLLNENMCAEFEYFMIQIVVQQLLRGLITENIYSYILGKLNNKVMQLYVKYYNLDMTNLAISIFGLFKKMQQLIQQMQPFLRHSSNLLSNFKIIEYILINNQNKIGSSQHIHKQVRQLQNYLSSKSEQCNALQYKDVNVVEMFEMLPMNKYILPILPGYKQFNYCLKYFGSQIHPHFKQVYLLGYDNFLYIQISNRLSFTVEIDVKWFLQYNDRLLKQISVFNTQMSSQNNVELNSFHQKMFELDRLIFSFHSRDIMFLFSVFAGLVQDTKIIESQGVSLKKYLTLISESLQMCDADIDVVEDISMQLLCGGIQLKKLLQEKFLGHEFSKYVKFMVTAYFQVVFARSAFEKGRVQQLVATLVRSSLYPDESSGKLKVDWESNMNAASETVKELVTFIMTTDFSLQHQPSLIYTDPSLRGLNFTACFDTVAAGVCGQTGMQSEAGIATESEDQYFIDQRLEKTSQALEPFFQQHNWTQRQLPKDARTFFFAGHGGGENILKGDLQTQGLVLMGCSSVTELQLNEHLRLELRRRLYGGKFLLGCLWDVLSGDLDRFSLQFLNVHQKLELKTLIEAVCTARSVCTFQGLTGAATLLCWNENW